MNIDKLNNQLEDYLKKEMPEKYCNGEYPFFDEDDLVGDVHNYLKKYHNKGGLKIFREFPIDLIAPLRLTPATSAKLEKKYPIRNYYDSIAKSGYHNLICEIETIIAENPFKNANRNKEGKYVRNYEPKYFDLVVIDNYPKTIQDELIKPKIVMEFKYEAGVCRRGNDLRTNLTIPKNNPEAVQHDLRALELLCRKNTETMGYFVFVDENEGEYIRRFLPSSLAQEFETIQFSGEGKMSIFIKKFKY